MSYRPPPTKRPVTHTITPWSYESCGAYFAATAMAAPASGTGGTAQRAYYVPFEISEPFTVKEVGWTNGTVAGTDTAQVGIYREDFTQVLECTATTTSGTSANQTIDVTDTVLPGPARYYMAFLCSGTTALFFRIIPAAGLLEACGIMQESSLADLPATATPIVTASAYLPHFYIAGHTLL